MKDYSKRKAFYRGIPCYYNPCNDMLWGRNWLYEILLNVTIWIDINVVNIDEFPIWIEEDKDFK